MRTRANKEVSDNGTPRRKQRLMWFPRKKKLGMQNSRHVETDVPKTLIPPREIKPTFQFQISLGKNKGMY